MFEVLFNIDFIEINLEKLIQFLPIIVDWISPMILMVGLYAFYCSFKKKKNNKEEHRFIIKKDDQTFEWIINENTFWKRWLEYLKKRPRRGKIIRIGINWNPQKRSAAYHSNHLILKKGARRMHRHWDKL